MSTVLLGTNRFEACETLIAHRGVPVLRIDFDGSHLTIDLRMPEGAEPLDIENNLVTTGNARLVSADRMVTVLYGDTLLIHAVQVDDDVILVDLDLRPLRAAIHTDAAGLHVGRSVLAANVVQGARIALELT